MAETWIPSTAQRWLTILAAAASLAALAGCGGDEQLSHEDFSDRLQSIDRREGARFERLAQTAMRLKPDQPLTGQVKRGMRKLAEANRRAADELEALDPPENAADATEALIAALRERSDRIERAAGEDGLTLRQLDEGGSITRAGEKIDRAFERLRSEGFLTE